MKIGIPSTIRADIVDRNMLVNFLAFIGVRTPTIQTLLATYVVPAGRRAQIANMSINIHTDTTHTVPGRDDAWFSVYNAAKGTMTIMRTSYVEFYDKAPANANVGSGAIMEAGDELRIYTSSNAVGGSTYYAISALVNEFDA